jgi:hypothetical protein
MAHLVKKYFATQLHVKLDHRIFATSLYLGMKASHSHGKADYIGILGSVLCIIHCLLMPALAFGSSYASHHEHVGMLSLDYFFILINGIAVYYATRNHKSIPVNYSLGSFGAVFNLTNIGRKAHCIRVAGLRRICFIDHWPSSQSVHLPDRP